MLTQQGACTSLCPSCLQSGSQHAHPQCSGQKSLQAHTHSAGTPVACASSRRQCSSQLASSAAYLSQPPFIPWHMWRPGSLQLHLHTFSHRELQLLMVDSSPAPRRQPVACKACSHCAMSTSRILPCPACSPKALQTASSPPSLAQMWTWTALRTGQRLMATSATTGEGSHVHAERDSD